MSTYRSLEDAINDLEHWLRLASFLHIPLKHALLSVLHNENNSPTYTGLPREPSALYKSLQTTHKQKIDVLVKKKVLQVEQVNLLRPANDTKVRMLFPVQGCAFRENMLDRARATKNTAQMKERDINEIIFF